MESLKCIIDDTRGTERVNIKPILAINLMQMHCQYCTRLYTGSVCAGHRSLSYSNAHT